MAFGFVSLPTSECGVTLREVANQKLTLLAQDLSSKLHSVCFMMEKAEKVK